MSEIKPQYKYDAVFANGAGNNVLTINDGKVSLVEGHTWEEAALVLLRVLSHPVGADDAWRANLRRVLPK